MLPGENSGRLSAVGHNARAGEVSAGPMYVLLQIYPLEARGDDDPTPLDAIAVDGSQERLEEYLGRVLINRDCRQSLADVRLALESDRLSARVSARSGHRPIISMTFVGAADQARALFGRFSPSAGRYSRISPG